MTEMTEIVESAAKIRKKLYAEVTAQITFLAPTSEDAEKLRGNFLQRRGIVLVDAGKLERLNVHRKSTRSTFTVTYKVHGGWRSDFIKKLEQDAIDTGVPVTELEVTVSRREIPEECPRKDCGPCEFATGKRDSPVEFLPVKQRTWSEPDTIHEESQQLRLPFWSRLRGGKND